jgi:tRNA-splicing ligase RtcB (3'-phosphate/5'-hydroxy nucleic acid ligase)
VILEGVESPKAAWPFYSTVHGVGRLFGRKNAKRQLPRAEMNACIRCCGVMLMGADFDESPMTYRRLPTCSPRMPVRSRSCTRCGRSLW